MLGLAWLVVVLAAAEGKEGRRLPSAIIIGVKKAGTRALLEYLRLHPAVTAPGPEVHFFDRHYDRGLDWYRSQMPAAEDGEMVIEKTPAYFTSKVAPERIRAFNPDTKLLLVVRDPVTRALSDYAQTASKREGMPPFEQMAFLENGSVNASWGGVRLGLYHRHLRRWLKAFPLTQIHFVSGERLIDSPSAEMQGVESFLGLTPFIGSEHFEAVGPKGFPCLRPRPSAAPHCLGPTKGRPHPNLSPDLEARLRTFFRPENEKLYRLVGRNFGWP